MQLLLIGWPILRAPGWPIEPGLYEILLLVGGAVILVGAVLLSIQRGRPFSASLAYLVAGVTIGLLLRAIGFAWYDPIEDAVLFSRAAELAVIVSLFGAGVKLDRALTWRGWRTPILLLAVAMPLTIVGMALLGTWLIGMTAAGAILLGAVLAPTDPVLADEVQVGGPMEREPEDEARFALTAEAGLNDGLAFPFVLLGLFIAGDESGWFGEWLAADVLYAIAVGVAIGAGAGWLLSGLITRLRAHGLLLAEYHSWIAIAGVLLIYGATEIVGAYGFLAAFVGGLAFRRRERDVEYHARVHSGADTVEKLTELALVLLLGSTVTLSGLAEPGATGWLLVPILILLIRPASVLVGLAGMALRPVQRAFIAWFGVRGIGSFYYAAVAIGAGVLTADEATTIYWTVIVCTGVSIIAHGITATPSARRLETGRD